MTTRRLVRLIGTVLLAATVLGACGSDSKPSTAATTETYVTVAPAQVSSRLAGTQAQLDALAAAPSSANAGAVAVVNNSWQVYEGNIRTVDPQAYLDGEDALARFTQAAAKDDAAAMKSAADKFRTMSQAYTAAHPG